MAGSTSTRVLWVLTLLLTPAALAQQPTSPAPAAQAFPYPGLDAAEQRAVTVGSNYVVATDGLTLRQQPVSGADKAGKAEGQTRVKVLAATVKQDTVGGVLGPWFYTCTQERVCGWGFAPYFMKEKDDHTLVSHDGSFQLSYTPGAKTAQLTASGEQYEVKAPFAPQRVGIFNINWNRDHVLDPVVVLIAGTQAHVEPFMTQLKGDNLSLVRFDGFFTMAAGTPSISGNTKGPRPVLVINGERVVLAEAGEEEKLAPQRGKLYLRMANGTLEVQVNEDGNFPPDHKRAIVTEPSASITEWGYSGEGVAKGEVRIHGSHSVAKVSFQCAQSIFFNEDGSGGCSKEYSSGLSKRQWVRVQDNSFTIPLEMFESCPMPERLTKKAQQRIDKSQGRLNMFTAKEKIAVELFSSNKRKLYSFSIDYQHGD